MLNKLGVIVSMPDMTINFRAKGDTVIARKVDSKAAHKCYVQSLKVTIILVRFPFDENIKLD